MGCSWSTLINPVNFMRAIWDAAVYCWRSLEVFCSRIVISEQAPTVDRIVAFESQGAEGKETVRRQISLQAHQGSFSSTMEDSPLSDPSLGIETIPENTSQSSRSSAPSFGDQGEAVSERMPKKVPTDLHPGTPLCRKDEQKDQERLGTSVEVTGIPIPGASKKSYHTFSSL